MVEVRTHRGTSMIKRAPSDVGGMIDGLSR